MSKLHLSALGICLLASPAWAQCVALEWDPMLGEPICTAFASSSGGGGVGGAGGSCETIRTGGQFGSAGTSCAGGSKPVYDPSGNGGPTFGEAMGVVAGLTAMGVAAVNGDVGGFAAATAATIGAVGTAADDSSGPSDAGVYGGATGSPY